MATSPAPESPISSISSHGSRASSVSRMSCVSQGMSSPYHVAQLPHHLSPNMPTMDSTVSSAKPEPELNIGTIRPLSTKLIKRVESLLNVRGKKREKEKNIFSYYPNFQLHALLQRNLLQRNLLQAELENYEIRDTRVYCIGWSISLIWWYRKEKKKTIARRDSGVKAESCNTPML